MTETIDPHRLEAERAALTVIDSLETNMLIRPHVWRAVNAALDAFDDSIGVSIMRTTARPGWAILRLNGTPWMVLPTYRMARRQRKALAALSGCRPQDLRLVRTEVVSV